MEGMMMPLGELAEFYQMKKILLEEKGSLYLSGCVDSQ